jgi:hypothetical protein
MVPGPANASDMLVAPAHILLLMVGVLALIREYPEATSALAEAYLALLVYRRFLQ